MEQRDLLKDQIEQLGKVLGNILSAFLGLKAKGEDAQGIKITNHRLQSELDIDYKYLVQLPKPKLIEYLKVRLLTAEHIELLAEYLKEVGLGQIDKNEEDARINLEKAMELLDIADEIYQMASFDRINKKHEIEKLLENHFNQ